MKAVKAATSGPIADRVEDMEFRIEGLEVVDLQDGVIRLKNVPVVDIAYHEIGAILERAGISSMDAERYIDGLAEEIGKDQIAKIFAQRAKRIG